jgi:glycosyltransferase involved in cell wall biosynthesis
LRSIRADPRLKGFLARRAIIRIGLTPRDFLAWQGGRELFQLIAESLEANLEPDDELAVATDVGRGGWSRRLASAAVRRVTRLATGRGGDQGFDLETLVKGKIPISPAGGRSFDVVGPFVRPPRGVGTPWVAYIPDVQHRRLPEMFSARECRDRDRDFQALLAEAAVVLVNAADVASDLRRFYPASRAEVMPLPFAACADREWFEGEDDVRARYGVEGPFFLCSNQFWKHKNHRVVLEAVALARAAGRPVRFVLTGDTSDYRHPDYYPGLLAEIDRAAIAGDVRILGFIPKQDQIRLMREAIAVVQPSLFEGGPGGGSIYNAIALGRPVIVSDLPVNREIEGLVTHYFDPSDPGDLLRKLRSAEAAVAPRQDPASLLLEGEKRRRQFGLALRLAFGKAWGG